MQFGRASSRQPLQPHGNPSLPVRKGDSVSPWSIRTRRKEWLRNDCCGRCAAKAPNVNRWTSREVPDESLCHSGSNWLEWAPSCLLADICSGRGSPWATPSHSLRGCSRRRAWVLRTTYTFGNRSLKFQTDVPVITAHLLMEATSLAAYARHLKLAFSQRRPRPHGREGAQYKSLIQEGGENEVFNGKHRQPGPGLS